MNRFYKFGECDWCHNRKRVFLTTFESEMNKLMCDHCRDFINHQRLVRDGIEDAVDLWDETSLGFPVSTEIDERFNSTKRPKKFVIKKSPNGYVTLFGYKEENKFVVEANNPRSLSLEKQRIWDYTHLGPAVRRFNIEVSNIEGGC